MLQTLDKKMPYYPIVSTHLLSLEPFPPPPIEEEMSILRTVRMEYSPLERRFFNRKYALNPLNLTVDTIFHLDFFLCGKGPSWGPWGPWGPNPMAQTKRQKPGHFDVNLLS